MKEKVYKIGFTWVYTQNPNEIESKNCNQSVEFDDLIYLAITNRITKQVCILKKGNKFGIYTNDHTYGMGGPGTWCNPTVNPFPYDEVKYCSFPLDEEYGVFAFRIGNKWGIIMVVDGSNEEEGIFDVEYLLTKRKIVVPCEYISLEDAELQLREKYDWKDSFATDDEKETTKSTRDVKVGTGIDKIRVTFQDGMIIEDSVVWKTLAETIKRIGVERVANLKILGNKKRNILLVDTHPTDDIVYQESQKEIEPGFYLLTYNNTKLKATYLNRISDELNLNLKIEIITYLS